MPVRWGALLVLVLAVAAGCTAPPPPPEGLPVDDDGKALPTVEGFVVDEAIRPLAGVVVRILGEEANGTTDEEGHYAIRRPTQQAEAVLVSAFATGYRPLSKQMQASRFTPARIDFQLEPDAALVPRVETLQFRGTLSCQVRTPLAWPVCTPPDISIGGSGITPAPREMTWALDTARGLAGAVVQVDWEAETPLAEQMEAILWGPVAGGERATGRGLANVTGTSPLRLEIDEATARGLSDWTAVWLEVRVPEQGSLQVGLAIQQRIDAYATLFYIDPAPPGYTLA